jgi:hypothetical protein
MSLYVSGARLTEAVRRLANWRGSVKSQASGHLFTFLALVYGKVGYTDFSQYEEEYDYAFFEEFFQVKTEADKPYFDPLNLKFRIKTHPHSNFSTARKSR